MHVTHPSLKCHVFSFMLFRISDLLIEKDPLVLTYISTKKDMPGLNCAAFIGGIVQAVLEGSNFVSTLSLHSANLSNCKFELMICSRVKSPPTGTTAPPT